MGGTGGMSPSFSSCLCPCGEGADFLDESAGNESHLLTFFACCSLLVCVVRDPGMVRVGEDADNQSDEGDNDEENEETDMMDALRMAPSSQSKKGKPEAFDDDFNAPHKWCRKCWAPKPERTHHCSACGRCVLKMGEWTSMDTCRIRF